MTTAEAEIPMTDPQVNTSVQWFELPLKLRQTWWRATDYGQHPPAPELVAQMPVFAAVAKLEKDRRKALADRVMRKLVAAFTPPMEDEQ